MKEILNPKLIELLDELKREFEESCDKMKPCIECAHFRECGAVLKNHTGFQPYDQYRFYYAVLKGYLHDLDAHLLREEMSIFGHNINKRCLKGEKL